MLPPYLVGIMLQGNSGTSVLLLRKCCRHLEKLRRMYFSNDLKGLVGMYSRIEEIESLLFSGNVNDVRIVGIWGMGGIGKTTLVTAVFDKYSSRFQSSCFLADVREASEKFGLPELKDELLSSLLNNTCPAAQVQHFY